MAQYKVPQDVEAEDKLLGPFTFRQFVYLMIIGGLVGLGVLFWGIFPPLIIILVPPILLLGALALPIKKDQPMETYLSAVVSFYLKPHTRIWEPGEPESTIQITTPKKIEEKRTKDLDEDEAMRRLSFLADIVDTEGYAIKGVTPNSAVKEEVYAEASDTLDMFDNPTASNSSINQTLEASSSSVREEAINQMRAAIERNANLSTRNATISHMNRPETHQSQPQTTPQSSTTNAPQPPSLPSNPTINQPSQPTPQNQTPPTAQQTTFDDPLSDEAVKTNDTIIKPDSIIAEIKAEQAEAKRQEEIRRQEQIQKTTANADPNIVNLANNKDFSIETIAKQAKRIKEKKDDEVYISLH